MSIKFTNFHVSKLNDGKLVLIKNSQTVFKRILILVYYNAHILRISHESPNVRTIDLF